MPYGITSGPHSALHRSLIAFHNIITSSTYVLRGRRVRRAQVIVPHEHDRDAIAFEAAPVPWHFADAFETENGSIPGFGRLDIIALKHRYKGGEPHRMLLT
jgi:hypothetical protein